MAEVLFRDGRELLERGEYAAACAKLAESYKLDAASGTLLNLALCHEREGRLATAWVEYQNALSRVRREGSEDRIAFARESIARVEPLVPRIHLEVIETPGATVSVSLGETALGPAAWGGAMPVDPGVITLRATAPGHRSHEQSLSIEAGQILAVRLPALEREETPSVPPNPAQVAASQSETKPPPEVAPPSEPATPKAEEDGGAGEGRRVSAYVAAGVGALGVAAGTYFGVVALVQKRESDQRCHDGKCDAQEDLSLYETAQLNATLSNVGFGVGLLGLGVGAYLYLTAAPEPPSAQTKPSSRSRRASTEWSALPAVRADGWGLSVMRRF